MKLLLLSLIISASACATTKEIKLVKKKPITYTGVFQCTTDKNAYMEAITEVAKDCLKYDLFATIYPQNIKRYRCKKGGTKYVIVYQCLEGEKNEDF